MVRKIAFTTLVPVALIIGVCLIPVAFVIATPDMIRSLKDSYVQ